MSDPIEGMLCLGLLVVWIAVIVALFSTGHWILALIVLIVGLANG